MAQSYVNEIRNQLTRSGSTVVFDKDNVIIATEVSEAQYRELLKSSYIEKMDVLSLKRYYGTGKESVQVVANIPSDNTQNVTGDISNFKS
jgi:hypothetical protein